METGEKDFFRANLEDRRQRLAASLQSGPRDQAVAGLLLEVDAALERLNHGTFGVCEECHESVEADWLRTNPLARVCLDHLTLDQKRALESDLEMAARIQRKLLPEPRARVAGWEIHYYFQPVGPVSGDYCDLILPEDGRDDLWFLIGDVSGKGVAASMLMAHLHAMFRSLTSVGLPLEKLLEAANRIFCQSLISGQYATLMCGRASRNGEVEIAGAGHVPALLLQASGVTPIVSHGLPLGMFCDGRFTSHRLELKPGDSLILYTDGLPETTNPGGTEYGGRRLLDFLSGQHSADPPDLIRGCLLDAANFSAGAAPNDDLTLMVIRREV